MTCTCPICRPSQAPRSPLANLPGWDIAQRIIAEQHNESVLQITREKDEWRDTFGGGWMVKDSPPVYGIIDPDYARVFTMARVIAWAEGYALLFHGSFTRDLDLIAVPWTASACDPDNLVRRIVAKADLQISSHPGVKEHGRIAWTLTFKTFGDPRFIDFSIMPRVRADQSPGDVVRGMGGG